MEVRIIQATKPLTPAQDRGRLRVCAYCRVSTDHEDQESSYEAQRTYYEAYIAAHPDWDMAGIYADSGISGTQARKRPEFLRMIADCEAGRIDLVLTKSISRFARNTVECLQYIRQLKERGVAVIFQKENINTLDAKGELLITIMASISQEESLSISQNIRLGIQYRMRQGKGRPNTVRSLGYRKEGDGLVIVPEEADTVRRIFREYLDGYSPKMICRHLMDDGVLTGAGGTTWYAETVKGMLENEIYAGELVLQKYFTESFLTKKLVRNTGQLPKYYVPDHHAPIVPRPVFYLTQSERRRRDAGNDPTKLRYAQEIPLSGRVACACCGRLYRRIPRKTKVEWRCRKDDGGPPCVCGAIREERLMAALEEALRLLPGHEKALAVERAALTAELARLDERLREDPEDVETALRRSELAHRELCLRQALELIAGEGPAGSGDPACADAEDFFARTRRPMTREGFPGELVIRYLDGLTVTPGGMAEVRWKAGLRMRIAL